MLSAFIIFLSCTFQRFILLLFAPVLLLVPPSRRRIAFELKEKDGPFSQPFLTSVPRAYHLSSEGEWEQVWPLIAVDIAQRFPVEIIITSPSLEKKLEALKLNYRADQVRFLRLPLLTAPFRCVQAWSQARSLYLCRYDFYPDLLALGLRLKRRGGEFGLLAASLKNKGNGVVSHSVWRWVHGLFTQRLLASESERIRFETMPRVSYEDVFDFRSLQVIKRLCDSGAVLQRMPTLLTWLEAVPREKRLIMGSCWPHDIFLLKGLSLDWRVLLAPHDFEESGLKLMQETLEAFGFKVERSNGEVEIQAETQIVLLLKRQVLVELYSRAGFAYIGGGFGRSIHSVKEPLFAGCAVITGPKIYRSTEYEEGMATCPERLRTIQTEKEMAKALLEMTSFAKGPPADYTKSRQQLEQAALSIRTQLFRGPLA